MNLVDENGKDLSTIPMKLTDASGEELSSEPPKKMTTKEIGSDLAAHMLNAALNMPNNEAINGQFDVLYHAALNILGHRILNVGLGFENANSIIEWDASRAFVHEKEVQEDLSKYVEEWKQKFMNGELQYHAGKK